MTNVIMQGLEESLGESLVSTNQYLAYALFLIAFLMVIASFYLLLSRLNGVRYRSIATVNCRKCGMPNQVLSTHCQGCNAQLKVPMIVKTRHRWQERMVKSRVVKAGRALATLYQVIGFLVLLAVVAVSMFTYRDLHTAGEVQKFFSLLSFLFLFVTLYLFSFSLSLNKARGITSRATILGLAIFTISVTVVFAAMSSLSAPPNSFITMGEILVNENEVVWYPLGSEAAIVIPGKQIDILYETYTWNDAGYQWAFLTGFEGDTVIEVEKTTRKMTFEKLVQTEFFAKRIQIRERSIGCRKLGRYLLGIEKDSEGDESINYRSIP